MSASHSSCACVGIGISATFRTRGPTTHGLVGKGRSSDRIFGLARRRSWGSGDPSQCCSDPASIRTIIRFNPPAVIRCGSPGCFSPGDRPANSEPLRPANRSRQETRLLGFLAGQPYRTHEIASGLYCPGLWSSSRFSEGRCQRYRLEAPRRCGLFRCTRPGHRSWGVGLGVLPTSLSAHELWPPDGLLLERVAGPMLSESGGAFHKEAKPPFRRKKNASGNDGRSGLAPCLRFGASWTARIGFGRSSDCVSDLSSRRAERCTID